MTNESNSNAIIFGDLSFFFLLTFKLDILHLLRCSVSHGQFDQAAFIQVLHTVKLNI